MSFHSWVLRKKEEWESNVIKQAGDTLKAQSELLVAATGAIETWQQIALVSQQATRDLAIAWEASLAYPEVDVSEDLSNLVSDLRDQVAQLEEQITLS